MNSRGTRMPYDPAPMRKSPPLPNRGRLAVHIIVSLEDWRIDTKLPWQVFPGPPHVEHVPDVPNFAWYQYGMRVGIWRLFDALEACGSHVSLALGGAACQIYPSVVKHAVKLGWDILGQGYHHDAMSAVGDERPVIQLTLEAVQRATGNRPRGWIGPGLVETWHTPDLLASEGIEYCCDWGPADDLPFELSVLSGKLCAIPYPVDMNDAVMYTIQQGSDAVLLERGKRHFDVLYDESAHQPRIFALALHPWITGVPHRIGYVRSLLQYLRERDGISFMSAGEIADWYRAAVPATV